MDADTSMQILVIILSATLAVFLILGIVLIIKMIQVADVLKRISLKAEDVVDNVEEAASLFKNAAAPVAISRLISNITDLVGRKDKGGK